jgi:hypothetical protein
MLNYHLKSVIDNEKFDDGLQKHMHNFVTSSVLIHQIISTSFQPSVTKFHYLFNLRDLNSVFQVRKFIFKIHN